MTKRQTTETSNQLIALTPGASRRTSTAGWRIEAPFLAHMIGEREKSERKADNRLAQARRDVPTILGAYGSAASLQVSTHTTLDLLA